MQSSGIDRISLSTGTLLTALLIFGPAVALAQQHPRVALPTQLAAPVSAQVAGQVPSSQTLRFGLTLPLRNVAGLQALLKAQQTPGNPLYRQFLSREQFLDRFGPTQADYERVLAYAAAKGFTVQRTFANRLLVNVAGSPTQVNNAFAVHMQMYKSAAQARNYYAPDVEPTIEAGVPILSVVGLSNREKPLPMLVHANTVQANTTGSGANGQFLGSDMRAAYAPNVSLDGAGQTVGLVELGPYNLSDVQMYFSAVNQPLHVPIYNALLDVDGVCEGSPATGGCDDGEEVIDIEQAISMAPGLSGLIVYEAYGSGSDAMTAFAQAASDDVAKQLSLSFGFGGTPATMPGYEQVFMELSAQGQNLFIASGDSGANVGNVGYPGNSPNVTDVGGTDLTTAGPGGPWQSETAWIGSGGGWNTQSPIPAYQTSAINGANQGSPTYRNIPDISMEANTDNFFCANGSCQGGIGGTSLAAPRWAAFVALANEQADGNPIGFLNPTFYALGQTSSYNTVFHDITEGNNFNTGSPDLFQAVPGYDLTSGFGTPNGQSMLDTLGAAPTSSTANFVLTASPATLKLTPGESGTSMVTVAPVGGFSGSVSLTAAVIGAPAGVTVSLDNGTLGSAGSTTLNVQTTSATPGGSFVAAISGTSGGVMHTAYVELALPDFSLSASPSALYLNQRGRTRSVIAVDAVNGFSTAVALMLANVPPLVDARFSPSTTETSSQLSLKADVTAPTSSGSPLTVSGTSGGTTRTVSSLTVAISAALGDCGLGSLVDLSASYNLTAIRTDGTAFTDGGLDGDGYAFSGALLTRARVLNGIRYRLGKPDAPNAVYGTGQTIALPKGHYSSLQLLATGIEGVQTNQTLTVTYTDGTTQLLTQSFSDWFVPSVNVNEGEAVAMPYRDTATGTPDNRQFNLYSYVLPLNISKTVRSLTLPNNRDIVLLAASLSDLPAGTEVNLARAYNATGIYTDGSTFPEDGGLDGGGAAYSANLLNDPAAGEGVFVGTSHFHLGGSNTPDAVYGAGQTIQLPVGPYADMKLLATGVQGDELAQPFTIHYTDGSTDALTLSLSDWSALTGYPHESLAIKTAYRDYNDGTQDQQAFNIYLYTLKLRPFKLVRSITLPENRDVLVLSMTLDLPSVVDFEPYVCGFLNRR